MRLLQILILCLFSVSLANTSLNAAVLPVQPEGKSEQKLSKRTQNRIDRLELKLAKAKSSKRKVHLQRKIDRLQEGSIVGLAGVLAGIGGMLMGAAVIAFGLTGSLLMYLGLLLGAGAIIFGIVDMRYAESLGLSWGAIVLGGLAMLACVLAIILVG